MLCGFFSKPRVDSKCSFPLVPSANHLHSMVYFQERPRKTELAPLIAKAFPGDELVSFQCPFQVKEPASQYVTSGYLSGSYSIWYKFSTVTAGILEPGVRGKWCMLSEVSVVLTFRPLPQNLRHQKLLSWWHFRPFSFDIQKVEFPTVITGPVFQAVSLLIHRVVIMLASVRPAQWFFHRGTSN